jgi:anti-anti-sigma regulatory factor
MAKTVPVLKVDEERTLEAIQDACEKLDGAAGEIVLDFSSVGRLDPSALKAMRVFAVTADSKAVRVVLHRVNVEIYKVLKLVTLTERFSFTT